MNNPNNLNQANEQLRRALENFYYVAKGTPEQPDNPVSDQSICGITTTDTAELKEYAAYLKHQNSHDDLYGQAHLHNGVTVGNANSVMVNGNSSISVSSTSANGLIVGASQLPSNGLGNITSITVTPADPNSAYISNGTGHLINGNGPINVPNNVQNFPLYDQFYGNGTIINTPIVIDPKTIERYSYKDIEAIMRLMTIWIDDTTITDKIKQMFDEWKKLEKLE